MAMPNIPVSVPRGEMAIPPASWPPTQFRLLPVAPHWAKLNSRNWLTVEPTPLYKKLITEFEAHHRPGINPITLR
jgi:hypothetical protein